MSETNVNKRHSAINIRKPKLVKEISTETLHGSKVSRESDLRSVPYNRTVFLRSIVKNVKSLSENQHNSLTVQNNLIKLHRLTQLVKMCVMGKNENSCSFRYLVICPLI